MGYKVALVGATGNVGREMLSILDERKFPADEVVALASRRSMGVEVSFGDKTLKCKDLATYDKGAIDQSEVAAADVHAFVDRLVAMPIAERLTFGWMHPGRVDVLGAGGLILSRVLHRCSAPTMVASEADILDGIAWSMV